MSDALLTTEGGKETLPRYSLRGMMAVILLLAVCLAAIRSEFGLIPSILVAMFAPSVALAYLDRRKR